MSSHVWKRRQTHTRRTNYFQNYGGGRGRGGGLGPKIAWRVGFLRWTRTCSIWPPCKNTPSSINTRLHFGVSLAEDKQLLRALFFITINDKRQVINTDKCHWTTGHCQDKYQDRTGRQSMTGSVSPAALKQKLFRNYKKIKLPILAF